MNLCDIKKTANCFQPFLRISYEDYDELYDSDGVCKCLPACNTIEYKIQIIVKTYKKVSSYKPSEAGFEFRYGDSEYFPLIRYQEFSTKDYLSYVGGLLGLFAGISVLSIVETFYFFTLRVFVNLFKTQNNSN